MIVRTQGVGRHEELIGGTDLEIAAAMICRNPSNQSAFSCEIGGESWL
jgi:hypothetical protein